MKKLIVVLAVLAFGAFAMAQENTPAGGSAPTENSGGAMTGDTGAAPAAKTTKSTKNKVAKNKKAKKKKTTTENPQ